VKSEALWPSHLSSKPHRLNYQNYQNSLAANSGTNGGATPMPSKRKTDEMSPNTRLEGDGVQEKKVRFNHPPSEDPAPHPLPKSSLPAGFFDNPALAPTSDDPEGEEQEQQEEEDDPEWSAFKAALEEPSSAEDTSANLFAKASVIAEPVLYDFGKPADALSSQEPGLVDDEEVPNPEEQEEEDPIEKKIREEKEEIMDRIQK
jgi:zinc finger protein 830